MMGFFFILVIFAKLLNSNPVVQSPHEPGMSQRFLRVCPAPEVPHYSITPSQGFMQLRSRVEDLAGTTSCNSPVNYYMSYSQCFLFLLPGHGFLLGNLLGTKCNCMSYTLMSALNCPLVRPVAHIMRPVTEDRKLELRPAT